MSFTGYQKLVVALLAFIQFTVVLDFMVLSPLGAILMPALGMTSQAFGLVVSAYAFAAGATGFLAAGFADSFDRKRFLVFFYVGFVVGTLLCGLAPSYRLLLVARVVTGAFAGVLGSTVLAIAADLFPMSMRGRVMGTVQTAFAASQVLGIPFALFLANRWGWHAPFLMIVVVALGALALIVTRLEPMTGHLGSEARTPATAFRHLVTTLTTRHYLVGFAATALLATGGFALMPFGSAFSVRNLHIDLEHLPWLYAGTGVCSALTGPLIGRVSDRFGKFRTFLAGSAVAAAAVLVYTRLGPISVAGLVPILAIMFSGIQARMISSQALMSGVPTPANRGAFMAVSSCVQQLSGGIAASIAGVIVIAPAAGPLLRFDALGWFVSGTIAVTCVLMHGIQQRVADPH